MNEKIRQKITEDLNNSKEHKLFFKDYKSICEYLEENRYQHSEQQKQKKRWKKEFNYIQEGKEYIITGIYINELPDHPEKIKNQILNYNLCLALLKNVCEKEIQEQGIEHMEEIINNTITKNQGITCSITINRLALQLGLINDYYLTYIGSPNQLSEYLEIDIKNIEEFYQKVTNYYKDDIKNTLVRLERNGVLIYQEIYRGEFIKDEEILTLSHETNEHKDIKRKIKVEYDTEIRDLTENEANLFAEIQSEIFKKHECKDMHEFLIKNRGDGKKFFFERNKRLYEEMKCLNVYKVYNISFSPSFIFLQKKSLENKMNKLFSDRILNNKLRDITKKIDSLCEAIEYEKYFIDTNFIPQLNINGNIKVINSEEWYKRKIKTLEQSYEDFKILTRELIKDYKRNKLKKIQEDEKKER